MALLARGDLADDQKTGHQDDEAEDRGENGAELIGESVEGSHAAAPLRQRDDFFGLRVALSISTSRSRVSSGKAFAISGQASLGKTSRNFQTRTAPEDLPTKAATAAGPPFSMMILEGVFSMTGTLPSVTWPRKHKITPGNVTIRNFRLMAHDGFRAKWTTTSETHERLRWARMYWQIRARGGPGTAAEAAQSMGMKDGTYRAYERAPGSSKTITMDHQQAIFFARKFNVDWTWLLTGDGTPFDGQLTDEQARVVEVMGQVTADEQKALAAMVEAFIQQRKAS